MKRILAVVIAAGCVLTAVNSAVTPAAAAVKKMAGMKCPDCGMWMPTHKTKTMYVPVVIHGTTYYCCPNCPVGKAGLAAMKKHHM